MSAVFYRHTGKTSGAGAVTAAGIAIPVSALLGALYALVTLRISVVPLNLLFVPLLGVCAGLCAGRASRLGTIRNTRIATVIGAVAGMSAWLASWAAHAAMLSGPAPVSMLDLPGILRHLRSGFEHGFGSISPSGEPVRGILLATVWIAEAALILGLSAFVSRALVADMPFCESCGRWTRKQRAVARFSARNIAALTARLKNGKVDALLRLPAPACGESDVLRADLFRCETCPDSTFLSLRRRRRKLDRRGRRRMRVEQIVRLMRISPLDAALLQGSTNAPLSAAPPV